MTRCCTSYITGRHKLCKIIPYLLVAKIQNTGDINAHKQEPKRAPYSLPVATTNQTDSLENSLGSFVCVFIFYKINILLSTIMLFVIYPKLKTQGHTKTCMQLFTAALFTIHTKEATKMSSKQLRDTLTVIYPDNGLSIAQKK